MEHVVDSSVRYRLSEAIGALSHALDLTEGQPVGHSQRSCMIGMELAARLDLDSEVRRDLFYAILLKDAGCSSSAARMCELFATDGRGYHRGIRSDLLPLEARILAVADVYEALTADRPYRGPLSRDTALEIMWKDAGSAFAPDCVAALRDVTEAHDQEI